jgi:hypothetical protein
MAGAEEWLSEGVSSKLALIEPMMHGRVNGLARDYTRPDSYTR